MNKSDKTSGEGKIEEGVKGTLKVDYGGGIKKDIAAKLVRIEVKYFFQCYDIHGKEWDGLTQAPVEYFTPIVKKKKTNKSIK